MPARVTLQVSDYPPQLATYLPIQVLHIAVS